MNTEQTIMTLKARAGFGALVAGAMMGTAAELGECTLRSANGKTYRLAGDDTEQAFRIFEDGAELAAA